MTNKEAIRVLEDNRPSVIFEDEDAQKRMAELCQAIDMAIEALHEVQKHEETFEWCHECKEYDSENHCCHRWSKVIRNTVEELKANDEDEPQLYTEDDYWNGMFVESAEAYKAWTGEEMGKTHGRLIDADRLKSYIDCGHLRPPTEVCFSELDVCNMVDKAPTVSADRPHGEWIKRGTKITCSHCKSAWSASFDTIIVGMKYCPDCGADMRGGDDE